jgi:hypothetical protein
MFLWSLLPCVALCWFNISPTRDRTFALFAKKKAKNGPKNHQKKSGMAWAMDFKVKPYDSTALRSLAELICNSYKSATGKSLLDLSMTATKSTTDLSKSLWRAPFACVAVNEKEFDIVEDGNVTGGMSSHVVYANLAALESFGVANGEEDFDQVIGQDSASFGLVIPGRMPEGKKFDSGYSKKVMKSKPESPLEEVKSTTIVDAKRWGLERLALKEGALEVEHIGVAYVYESWTTASGATCRPGGVVEEAASPDIKAQDFDLDHAIDAQALLVRNLKSTGTALGVLSEDSSNEPKGLPNSSPEVKAAVTELLRLKGLRDGV